MRDPRAVYSSVRKGGGLWGENNRNVTLQCNYYKEDMDLGSRLGNKR